MGFEHGPPIVRLQALAHPTRYALVRELTHGGGAVGELARRLAVPAQELDAHLTVLVAARLVTWQDDEVRLETGALYTLGADVLRDLFEA